MTITTRQADPVSINRAPKGGAVSSINGLFYKGGQFMPLASTEFHAGPARLEGSARQVAWATRLRDEALARIELDIRCLRMMLDARKPVAPAGARKAIRRDSMILHRLMTERSAARIIGRRADLAA